MAHNNDLIGPVVGAERASATVARHMRSRHMTFHDQALVCVTARRPA